MRRQARSFGAEFLLAEAESLDLEGRIRPCGRPPAFTRSRR
jgi:hypothetical protein